MKTIAIMTVLTVATAMAPCAAQSKSARLEDPLMTALTDLRQRDPAVAQKIDEVASSYVLGAVPLFIFMGSLLIFIQVIENGEGDGGEGQPFERVRIACVPAKTQIPATIGPGNHHIVVVPHACRWHRVPLTSVNHHPGRRPCR